MAQLHNQTKKLTTSMNINQFSKLVNLTAHTLRYYEKIGLITGVRRNASGHRDYVREDLTWIDFLKKLQATGMPIKLMQVFSKLRAQGDRSITERRKLLEQHREKIQNEIKLITFNVKKIDEKIKFYRAQERKNKIPSDNRKTKK
jgi:DNA-binding transcriptional MerR regulator